MQGSDRFTPHPLLQDAHVQTVAGLLWPRPRPQDEGAALFIPTADGSRLLARVHLLDQRRDRLAVLLLHGLEGSVTMPYMRSAAYKALRAGMHVIRLNLRSCGGSEQLSPTLYHAGRSEDIADALRYLRDALGLPRVALWGFSLGGNLALKLAGEGPGAGAAPVAVVGVSPVTDLEATTAALDRPENHLYRSWLLRIFRLRLLRQRAHYRRRYDLSLLPRIHTIRDFHERFVAPHFGFADADDYHARASAAPALSGLQVPTLVIHAEDDPIVPLPGAVAALLREHPAVRLLLTARGGHLGFIGARPEGDEEDRHWAENRAIDFLAALAQAPDRRARAGGRAAPRRWRPLAPRAPAL